GACKMFRGACEAELDVHSEASDVARVSGLESRLLPLRAFPLRKWYYANRLWYYHTRALHHDLHVSPIFYQLVDPALRELCEVLLSAGLCTTPCCQGHFYPYSRFERIWNELSDEAAKICGDGLIVRDSETGEAFRFHDQCYRIDWRDFDTFYHEA